MLRAVIFDIDGTLYDYAAAHARAFRALSDYACDAYGLTGDRFRTLYDRADALLKARAGASSAVHNRLIRCQLMLEALGRPIGDAPALASLYWSTLLQWLKPFPGLREAFDRLKAMGVRIGIGTNMTADWQYAKLNALKIMDLVDFMVTSEEAGAEKPDRRLFDLCAEKAGCAPSECAFVGDSIAGDVAGALRAGMLAVWFDPSGKPEPPPEGARRIASLSEVPELIASL